MKTDRGRLDGEIKGDRDVRKRVIKFFIITFILPPSKPYLYEVHIDIFNQSYTIKIKYINIFSSSIERVLTINL